TSRVVFVQKDDVPPGPWQRGWCISPATPFRTRPSIEEATRPCDPGKTIHNLAWQGRSKVAELVSSDLSQSLASEIGQLVATFSIGFAQASRRSDQLDADLRGSGTL